MKKIAAGFAAFLTGMLICTLVSKSIYAYRLPMVSTCVPETKYVEHRVEAEGIIVAGGERPVTYLPGLRIEAMSVQVGDRVEEGDELFRIDLKDLEEKTEARNTEIARLSLQIDTILENQELARQKKELELARAREDYDMTARIRDTQVGRAAESYARAERELEEEGGSEEGDKELKNALQSAAYGEADAKAERDQAVKEAGRKVEDILLPEEEASELAVAKLERETLSADLQDLKQVREHQGVVTAPFGGVVTEIITGVGQIVPESAVLLISDESLPCQLKVVLDKEQKKYVGLGDEVSVKLEGKSRGLEEEIDYLSESRSSAGSYEAWLSLPEGEGIPGMSGTLSCSERGEKQKLCIPLSALKTESDRNYVWVLREREGILGEEYYVEEVTVRVADKNDTWAALEEGAVDKDSNIITSATREIQMGDVVRWEQE